MNSALDLVDKLAAQIRRQISRAIPAEELTSYGREGLLTAARTFDASRGVPFRCWATLRIRGTMIDGLRSTGALPRRTYRRLRALEAADTLQGALVEDDAAKPTPDARAADSRLEQYIAGLATAMAVGFVTSAHGDMADVEHDREDSPEALVGRAQVVAQMRESIARLPDNERRLVERHYFDGLTMDEAAREIGLSKSWGSRLHARAIEFLARDLKRSGIRQP